MGEGRGVYRVLVGKTEGKRPRGRPGRRWDDYIEIDAGPPPFLLLFKHKN